MTVTENPIDFYLAEQASLTAVQRFAEIHEADVLPRHDRYYRDLIPLHRPGPGEQYGFEVDLDACTGCKACVTACHNMNGLDDGEAWRTVGMLHGSNGSCSNGGAHRQTVPTACHHCVDPACMSGCPANAYTKDPVTGIVKHLDDQCIGCGYCTFTCPYEVPQYNARLGIVRKCDMCQDRLAAGEAPACVQGCPNNAIRISVVEVDALVVSSKASTLVPGAPSSHVTVPATVYRTTRPRSDLIAADHYALRPALAHPPLALMLVLTQLSVGAFVVDLLTSLRAYNAIVALGVGLLAIGASIFHLGRPMYAFRAALGVRHSWLSREIIAFGAFAGLATLYAAASFMRVAPAAVFVLGGSVALSGLTGVACSVMVYAVTGRTWWRARTLAPKFLLTSTTCGLATVLFTTSTTDARTGSLAIALICATAVKLLWEAAIFRHLLDERATDLKRTAMLLSGDLGRSTWWRFIAGGAGGIGLPVVVLALSRAPSPPTVLCSVVAAASALLVLAGELIERTQFFRALISPRMPGDLP